MLSCYSGNIFSLFTDMLSFYRNLSPMLLLISLVCNVCSTIFLMLAGVSRDIKKLNCHLRNKCICMM